MLFGVNQDFSCLDKRRKSDFSLLVRCFVDLLLVGSAENRLVTLCPKITCTCRATTVCYHVLKQKLSFGVMRK